MGLDFNSFLSGGTGGNDNRDSNNDSSAESRRVGVRKKSNLILIGILLIVCIFTLDPKNQTIKKYAYCDGSTLTFFVSASDAGKIIPGQTTVEVSGGYSGVVSQVGDAPLSLEQVADLFPGQDVVSVFDLTNKNYQVTVETGGALDEGIHAVTVKPAAASS